MLTSLSFPSFKLNAITQNHLFLGLIQIVRRIAKNEFCVERTVKREPFYDTFDKNHNEIYQFHLPNQKLQIESLAKRKEKLKKGLASLKLQGSFDIRTLQASINQEMITAVSEEVSISKIVCIVKDAFVPPCSYSLHVNMLEIIPQYQVLSHKEGLVPLPHVGVVFVQSFGPQTD